MNELGAEHSKKWRRHAQHVLGVVRVQGYQTSYIHHTKMFTPHPEGSGGFGATQCV